MRAVTLWRAGEQAGDRLLCAMLLAVGAASAAATQFAARSFSEVQGATGLLDWHDPFALFAAIVLGGRFAMAGGRAWMLGVDAARMQVPALAVQVWRVEALRALLFAALPAAPFAFAGGTAATASVLAVTLTGVVVGVLCSVAPYRFYLPLAGVVLALLLSRQIGVLDGSPAAALAAAILATMVCAVYIGRRLRRMATEADDVAPGAAYSMALAISRHVGSIWSAPNSAPLEVMSRANPGGSSPPEAAPMGLVDLSPLVHRRSRPARAVLDWSLTLAGLPALMIAFLTVPSLLSGTPLSALPAVAAQLWPMAVLLWVPLFAVGFLGLGFLGPIAAQLQPGHPVRETLQLLPGMPSTGSAWRRVLQPLVWPPLVVTTILVLSAMPLMRPGLMTIVPIVVAVLTTLLIVVQPLVATQPGRRARRWWLAAVVLFALPLVAFWLVVPMAMMNAAAMSEAA